MQYTYVYILRCADGSYYTGLTHRTPEERLAEHQSGLVDGFTQSRRPVALVYSESFLNAVDAIAAERRIKGWSRTKKEALITGRFDLLPGLARRKSKP